MIIVAVACLLTGYRPRRNPIFWNIAVLFVIYIYTITTALMVIIVRLDLAINCFLRSFFFGFSAIKDRRGRTEMRTMRERKERQLIRTVRDISRDDRARIPTCRLRTATDRFAENYSFYLLHVVVCRLTRWYSYTRRWWRVTRRWWSARQVVESLSSSRHWPRLRQSELTPVTVTESQGHVAFAGSRVI